MIFRSLSTLTENLFCCNFISSYTSLRIFLRNTTAQFSRNVQNVEVVTDESKVSIQSILDHDGK